MNRYEIREVWGAKGAPLLDTLLAKDAGHAVVAYLRSHGYAARIMPNGDLITSDDAPSLRADKVAS